MYKRRVWIVGGLLIGLFFLAACQSLDENVGGGIESPDASAGGERETADDVEPLEPAPAETGGETAGQPAATATAETPAESPTEAPEPTQVERDLPALPRMMGATAAGGGAPETAFEAAPAAEPSTASLTIAPADFFSGTNFILETSLPAEPAEATALRQPARDLNLERAAEIAQRFGFEGPLYQEALPAYAVQPADEANPFVPTLPFYAIDGDEFLTIMASGAFYENRSIQPSYPSQVAFEEAEAAATAFLEARGLLDFPYVVASGFGGDVLYRRTVDGKAVQTPELFVHVNDAGEVVFATADWLPTLEQIGPYPLIAAETAWQTLQEGVHTNGIPYEIMPMAETDQIIVTPERGEFQSWTRAYQPGEEVFLYTTPAVYLPVADDDLPLVRVFDYTLVAPGDALRALAAQTVETSAPVIIQGIVGEQNRRVSLTEWEPAEDREPLFLEGVIERTEAGVLLVTSEGETYLLPNAPAAVADGLEVFVFAWLARDAGQPYPLLEWQNIDRKVPEGRAAEGEPLIPETLPGPVTYHTVTVTQIEQAYYYMAAPEYTEDGYPVHDAPAVVLQPVWKFTGTAESDASTETAAFFVQAVEPAYLEIP